MVNAEFAALLLLLQAAAPIAANKSIKKLMPSFDGVLKKIKIISRF